MKIKIIAFFALIFFSIAYVCFFRCYFPESILSFTDSLVTTFVSTLLSIIVGIYLYEYQQNKNQKYEIERLKSIVKAESTDILSILNDGGTMNIILDGIKKDVLITLISPLAHEEAGKSGQFNALITENLFHISRKIRLYNLKVNHLLGLIQNNSNTQYIEHAIDNVNDTKNAVIEACNLVNTQISKA